MESEDEQRNMCHYGGAAAVYNGVNGARSTAVLPSGAAVAPRTGAVDPVDAAVAPVTVTGNEHTALLRCDFSISPFSRSLKHFYSRTRT